MKVSSGIHCIHVNRECVIAMYSVDGAAREESVGEKKRKWVRIRGR